MSLTVGELNATISLDNRGFNNAIDQAESKFQGFSSRLSASIQRTATAIQPLALGIFGAAAGLGALGLGAIQAAANMEQSRIAFTTLLGSAKDADAFLGQLQKFAASTPFNFVGLQDSAKRLLAMGFAAKDIVPTLTNVGDAVAALGSGQAGIDNITYALGQMSTSGKVHTQDMMQLTNAGVAAWQMLADKLHMTVAQAQDAVQRGEVSSATGLDAIMSGMHSRYGGLMAKQSQTVTGLFSNLQDIATQSLTVIGDKLIKTFDVKGGLAKLTAFVTGMSDTFAKLDLKKLAPAAAVLGGAILGVLVPAFAALAISIGSAVIAAAPFLLIGAAIGGVAYLIYTHWDQVSAALKPLTDVILPKLNELWQSIQPALSKVRADLGPLGAEFSKAFEEWKPTLEWIGKVIMESLGNSLGFLIDVLKVAIPVAIDLALGALHNLAKMFDGIGALLRGDWGRAWTDFRGIIENTFAGLSKIHVPLPHFSMHGGFNPKDWAEGKNLPGLDVNWYGSGAIFRGPQVIGVGERGPEAVVPLSELGRIIRDAISGNGRGSGATINMNNYGSVNPRRMARELSLELA